MAYPTFEKTKTAAQEFALLSRGLSKGLDYLRKPQVGESLKLKN